MGVAGGARRTLPSLDCNAVVAVLALFCAVPEALGGQVPQGLGGGGTVCDTIRGGGGAWAGAATAKGNASGRSVSEVRTGDAPNGKADAASVRPGAKGGGIASIFEPAPPLEEPRVCAGRLSLARGMQAQASKRAPTDSASQGMLFVASAALKSADASVCVALQVPQVFSFSVTADAARGIGLA